MEPLSARNVFPCFDEPGLKATFDIQIGHPDKYSAFSNMPMTDSQPIEYVSSVYTVYIYNI
jgi:aminopeptidase N